MDEIEIIWDGHLRPITITKHLIKLTPWQETLPTVPHAKQGEKHKNLEN